VSRRSSATSSIPEDRGTRLALDEPQLTLVIPAYDEAERLPLTLPRVAAWLDATPFRPAELILADDGSRDRTLEVMRRFAADRKDTSVLALAHRGKAATVRAGILAARGRFVVFSDADLSVPLQEIGLLTRRLERGFGVAIGSREAPGARREHEPFYRHLMGRGFNAVVQTLLVVGVRDTQCGFKAFTREAAQAIFTRLRRYGDDAPEVLGPMVTAFDVEVLFLARKLGYRIAEVPVTWHHEKGSKVRPLVDAYRMARDVLGIKWNEWNGAYAPGRR
jgi:dolichyl-phosphate beta-glucosyltransferase